MNDFSSHVSNGVEFLDRELGLEWVYSIDLDILDVGDCDNCVAGQVYPGGYADLMNDMDLTDRENCGFTGASGDMPALTEEWCSAISALRNVRREH